jgi:hypothetical protein
MEPKIKIAFIIEYYFPIRHDASGKICKQICERLSLSRNVEITVFSMSDMIRKSYYENRVFVVPKIIYRNIYRPQFLYLINTIDFSKKIKLTSSYVCSKIINLVLGKDSQIDGYTSFINKYISDKKFDYIVFCCGNYKILKVIDKNIEEKYKGKMILYSLDPFYENKLKQASFSFSKINDEFSLIMVPPAFFHNHPELKKNNNVIPVNFPIVWAEEDKTIKKNNKITLCYFGSFYNVRDNEGACAILNNLPEYIEIIFYTDAVPSIKKRFKRITFKSFVFGRDLEKAQRQTDFFINIDNDLQHSDYVPSKTYEYIGLKKPIITFFSNKNSYTLKDLSKYDLSLTVDINENILESQNRIIEYIKQNNGIFSKLNLPFIYRENNLDSITKIIKNFVLTK